MSELIQTINTDEDRKTAKEQLEFLTSLLKEDSGGGDNSKKNKDIKFRTISWEDFHKYIVDGTLNDNITKQNRAVWNINDEFRCQSGYSQADGQHKDIIVEINENNINNSHSITRNIDGITYSKNNIEGYVYTEYYGNPNEIHVYPKGYNKSSTSQSYQTTQYGRGGTSYYYYSLASNRPILQYKEKE